MIGQIDCTPILFSKNTPSVPVCKSWRIHMHTFLGPFHLQKIIILSLFPVCKSQVAYFECLPFVSYDSSWAQISYSYYPHDREWVSQFSSSHVPICPVFQAKSEPSCCFLTCFHAGKSKKETLTVNIFWLGIHHETRFCEIQDCRTES